MVKDIRRGSGPPLTWNDRLTFRYVGVEYRSGKVFEARWAKPFIIQAFGNGELLVGQERGMLGMRVGGRRELIVPERLAYNNGVGSLIYLTELVSIVRRPGKPSSKLGE